MKGKEIFTHTANQAYLITNVMSSSFFNPPTEMISIDPETSDRKIKMRIRHREVFFCTFQTSRSSIKLLIASMPLEKQKRGNRRRPMHWGQVCIRFFLFYAFRHFPQTYFSLCEEGPISYEQRERKKEGSRERERE